MPDEKGRMFYWLVYIVVLTHFIAPSDSLTCYCTEEKCLSEERSNMCVQDNPDLGCYKQYYSKMEPHITMGCVRAGLLCDSSRFKPTLFMSEWPHTECCYTELCNRNLTLPPEIVSETVEDTTDPNLDHTIQSDLETTHSSSEQEEHNSNTESRGEYNSSLHPVFMLLIIVVIAFLVVVIASILVIIKIWVYKRKKSKPKKSWIIQQKMLNSKAQMSHLLTVEPSESTLICHELSSNSSSSGFDVP